MGVGFMGGAALGFLSQAVSQREGCSLARTLPCESRPMETGLECLLSFVAVRVWNDLLVWKRFRFRFLILLQW